MGSLEIGRQRGRFIALSSLIKDALVNSYISDYSLHVIHGSPRIYTTTEYLYLPQNWTLACLTRNPFVT